MRATVVAVLCLSGCGYRFTAPGGPLPEGIRAVQAPVMNNLTAEPAAETLFTQALREQLARSGTLGGDDAEARIEGTVVGVAMTPMVASPNQAPSYRLTATVELQLRRASAVLSQSRVTGDEDVLSGVDVVGTERNRQAGLRRLADSMMREGYERLCSGW